jgi:hypothetical protein
MGTGLLVPLMLYLLTKKRDMETFKQLILAAIMKRDTFCRSKKSAKGAFLFHYLTLRYIVCGKFDAINLYIALYHIYSKNLF